MKNLCVYIPDDLFKKFKIQIAKDNTTIKAAVLGFLNVYTQEVENDNKEQKGDGENIPGESSESDKEKGKQ